MSEDLVNKNNELKRCNRLYQDILDKVMQGIYVVNANREIVWYNKLMQRIDGVNRDEVMGASERAIWKNINFDVGAITETFKTGKASKEKLLPYNTKNGRKVNAFMQAFPVYHDNQIEYVYLIINYIDYFKKLLDRKKHYDSKVRIFNDTIFTFDNILGGSKKIRNVVSMAKKVAQKKSPVLLIGQTGTGKELFAQGIHNANTNNQGRFVAINCATIPENLMETILFGSVKGAFTGALDKPGLLEEAHDGTLFLDELDSLSTLMQSKLLRVLQEKEACRIGDNKNYPVNCRIISSTNRDLNQLLKNGSIRQDLYFRLAVVTLEIPPLADRMEDIPVLVDYFISIYNDEFELNIQEVDDDVMEVFASYHWPGNVRELEHAIEYMMNFADSSSSRLSVRELPMKLKNIDIKQQSREKIDNSYNENLHEAISEFEKNFILNILNKENWNVTRAAKKMGIHREALYYRIKKHNLHEKQALES